jgi:hypothetical protein
MFALKGMTLSPQTEKSEIKQVAASYVSIVKIHVFNKSTMTALGTKAFCPWLPCIVFRL